MTGHSKFSPSGAHRWLACPGSLAMESRYPNTSSSFADEGTLAHALASKSLNEWSVAEAFIGWTHKQLDPETDRVVEGTVDQEMADYIQNYLDVVASCLADGTLLVERRVDFSEYINQPGQTGTADAIVISADGKELQLHDLKYGMGVQVFAKENEQLMLYALGAFHLCQPMGDFERVKMFIHMPRLDHVDEWECSVEELLAFAERAKQGAALAEACNLEDGSALKNLNPTDKGCRFCRAKADCPALTKFVVDATAADFEDLTQVELPVGDGDLGKKLRKVDLIETWCKAVRGAVERLLMSGQKVDGYKLVEGRKGHRKWVGEKEVEELMVGMNLSSDVIFKPREIITPAVADKQFKKKHPAVWAELEKKITQNPGQPSVAPVEDKREPWTPAADATDFEDLTTETMED